jgi:hypothetical protein
MTIVRRVARSFVTARLSRQRERKPDNDHRQHKAVLKRKQALAQRHATLEFKNLRNGFVHIQLLTRRSRFKLSTKLRTVRPR